MSDLTVRAPPTDGSGIAPGSSDRLLEPLLGAALLERTLREMGAARDVRT